MNKIIVCVLGILCTSYLTAQERKMSGGIIGGVSMDWYHNSEEKGAGYSLSDRACSFHVGFQSQFDFQQGWSVDAALLYGQRRGKFVPSYGYYPDAKVDETFARHYLAVNGVLNYNMFQRFKLGIGVEPTLYFKETVLISNALKAAFDIPLVVKASYSFRYFDISLAYKNGFCPVMKGAPLAGNTRARDLQFSIYIPLFRR